MITWLELTAVVLLVLALVNCYRLAQVSSEDKFSCVTKDCIMSDRAADESEVEFAKKILGWRGFSEKGSDIAYFIDPKTVNMADLKLAIRNRQSKEFFIQNYTAKAPANDKLNRTKWVYRNS
ncbi:hypothetical protein EDD21DRAFT_383155, partial [Dissophora ornata]